MTTVSNFNSLLKFDRSLLIHLISHDWKDHLPAPSPWGHTQIGCNSPQFRKLESDYSCMTSHLRIVKWLPDVQFDLCLCCFVSCLSLFGVHVPMHPTVVPTWKPMFFVKLLYEKVGIIVHCFFTCLILIIFLLNNTLFRSFFYH